MEKLACASCGAALEPSPGPGRPKTYCSEACRRVAEFQIRGIVRRLEKYELELRELKVHTNHWDLPWRGRRMRALKRWIETDTAKLREILCANNQVAPAKSAEIE